MPKVKELSQAEKDARTSIWFISSEEANNTLAKIHDLKIKISAFAEYNTIIMNRDFTKKEYKKLFPIVKSDLL